MPEVNDNPPDAYVEQSDDIKVQAKLDHHTTMLGGVSRLGKVVEFKDGDQQEPKDGIPRVLVQIGGSSEGSFIRNWMPWTTARAGYDGEWWAPERDEQVLVIAPSGNLTQGIIVGSLFRGALTFDTAGDIAPRDPIPDAAKKEIHQRIYKDGSAITYDRNRHQYSLAMKETPKAAEITSADIVANESVVLTAGSTKITINQNGAVNIVSGSKEVTIEGDVTINGNAIVTGTVNVG